MYYYETEKPKVFLERNQADFLRARSNVQSLLESAGAFKMGCAFEGITGDSWLQMAYVDRLVELGEIKEIAQSGTPMGQYRIFVRAT